MCRMASEQPQVRNVLNLLPGIQTVEIYSIYVYLTQYCTARAKLNKTYCNQHKTWINQWTNKFNRSSISTGGALCSVSLSQIRIWNVSCNGGKKKTRRQVEKPSKHGGHHVIWTMLPCTSRLCYSLSTCWVKMSNWMLTFLLTRN